MVSVPQVVRVEVSSVEELAAALTASLGLPRAPGAICVLQPSPSEPVFVDAIEQLPPKAKIRAWSTRAAAG